MSLEPPCKPTAADVNQIISEIDPALLDPDSPMNTVARIHIASWFKDVGPDVGQIARFLGISENDVDLVAERFCESGVWCDDQVDMSCIEGDAEFDFMEFATILLIGGGMVQRQEFGPLNALGIANQQSRLLLGALHLEKSAKMWTTIELRALLERMDCPVNNPAVTMHQLTKRGFVRKISATNRPDRQKRRCLTNAGVAKAEQIVSDISRMT